jgi:hypothetical protein
VTLASVPTLVNTNCLWDDYRHDRKLACDLVAKEAGDPFGMPISRRQMAMAETGILFWRVR